MGPKGTTGAATLSVMIMRYADTPHATSPAPTCSGVKPAAQGAYVQGPSPCATLLPHHVLPYLLGYEASRGTNVVRRLHAGGGPRWDTTRMGQVRYRYAGFTTASRPQRVSCKCKRINVQCRKGL